MAPVVHELSIEDIVIKLLVMTMAMLLALAELTHIYFMTHFIYQLAKSVYLTLFPLATLDRHFEFVNFSSYAMFFVGAHFATV